MAKTDAEQVAAIDRAAELKLLAKLLDEAARPVPPPPPREEDRELSARLRDLLNLIASALQSTSHPQEKHPPMASLPTGRDGFTEPMNRLTEAI